MASSDTSLLTTQVEKQLPSHIRETYPRLVEFIRGYYQWLSYEGNPYNALAYHMDRVNFEKSLDEYTNYLKQEYLYNVPESILADKQKLIKFSRNFAGYIGTEDSFKFLFQVVYDEKVEMQYPKEQILRTSDGEWVSDEVVIYTTNSGYTLSELLYKELEQTYEIASGVYETVRGVIGNVIAKSVGNYQILEIRLINLTGDIKPNLPVTIENMIEYTLSVGAEYQINDGGLGYVSGDYLYLQNAGTYTREYNNLYESVFDTELTTTFQKDDIVLSQNGTVTTNFTYDGRYVTLDNFTINDDVIIEFPRYDGLIVVDQIDTNGTIKSIKIVQTPIGVDVDNKLYSHTNGIDVDLFVSGSRELEGYYRGTKGHLSSFNVLQDSDFYQEYSYVIKTGMDIDVYRDVVEQVLHPAGMKMFGSINIFDLLDVAIKSISSYTYVEQSTYVKAGYVKIKYVSEDYGYI